MITKAIRKHIDRIEMAEPFTTGDLLMYGTRAAVDQTLSRLVRGGFIVRLAPGVFAREVVKEYSKVEIRAAKLKNRVIKAIATLETHSAILPETVDESSDALVDCMSEFRRLSSNMNDLIGQAS